MNIVYYIRKDHPTGPGLFYRSHARWTPYMNQALPFNDKQACLRMISDLRVEGFTYSIVTVTHSPVPPESGVG